MPSQPAIFHEFSCAGAFRASGAGAPVEIGPTATNSFNDTTATAGVVYTYTVKVKGLLGDSAASNADTGFRVSIGVPAGVVATDGDSTANVGVTWGAVAGATGYRVSRAEGAANPIELGTVAGATLVFNDPTAAPLVQYSYTVAALVGAIAGPPSTANTSWRNVAAPQGFSATDGSLR